MEIVRSTVPISIQVIRETSYAFLSYILDSPDFQSGSWFVVLEKHTARVWTVLSPNGRIVRACSQLFDKWKRGTE